MADETKIDLAEGEGASEEMRPCAFCGHAIHPSSHLCTFCGGHVGLAWGTVHKELFLFLFLAVMVIVGCLASWTGRTPAASEKQLAIAMEDAEKRAAEDTDAAKKEVDRLNAAREKRGEAPMPYANPVVPKVTESDIKTWDTVEPAGRAMNGLDSIRGVLMLALAAYGLIVGIFNILHRRLVMWPFVLSGMLALWVGLSGVISASKSVAWERWTTWAQRHTMDEQLLAKFRAVPPGFILLTLAGIILLVKLIGGILAVATRGKPGADAGGDAGARRRRKESDPAVGTDTSGAAGGSTPTPAK